MKRIVFFATCLFLLATTSFAQTVPQGMQYQAVARNLSGNIIGNEKISLRISLQAGNNAAPTVYYTEEHSVITNSLGLFALVIGEGKAQKGAFKDVPWSTQDIWMQVSIKDKGSVSFSAISNSKLLAVPYAFHAATASQLVGENSSSSVGQKINTTGAAPAQQSTGVSAQVWSLKGNSKVNALLDRLGTTDLADLVIITNNLERMRVGADGNVGITNSLTVGKDLTTQGTVNLNTVSGSTTVNGPLTVSKGKATVLTGTATVTGATALNNTLQVTGATALNNTLQVTGAATLNNTLQVTGTTTLKNKVVIDNATFNSTAADNGALVVAGGAGIGKNLHVGGSFNVAGAANLGGNTTLGAKVIIADASPSTAPENGALVVAGGMGVSKELNVKGAAALSNTLLVAGETNLMDSLIVAGGASFAKDLSTEGQLTAKGLTVSTANTAFLATFENLDNSEGDGIEIKLGKTHPALNGSGYLNITNPGVEAFQQPINTIRGWIIDKKPFATTDLLNLFPASLIAGSACKLTNVIIDKLNGAIPLPLNMPDVHILDETTIVPEIDFGLFTTPAAVIPSLDLPGFQLIPKIPEIDCSVLPAFSVPNIAFTDVPNSLTNANQFLSFKDKDGNELGSVRAQSVYDWSQNYLDGAYFVNLMASMAGIDLVGAMAGAVSAFTDITESYNELGVEYASGHADYAEWMPRAVSNEQLMPGHIVGVKGGKISKNIIGAEQIMAVSSNPIMVGNMPAATQEASGNKIAFMGQVPVSVVGAVNTGDFIIANGDGYGKAVAPANLTAQHLKLTVGRALTGGSATGVHKVNVLVGTDNADYDLVIENLDNRVKALETKLDNIINGFKAYGEKVKEINEKNKKSVEARKEEIKKQVEEKHKKDIEDARKKNKDN